VSELTANYARTPNHAWIELDDTERAIWTLFYNPITIAQILNMRIGEVQLTVRTLLRVYKRPATKKTVVTMNRNLGSLITKGWLRCYVNESNGHKRYEAVLTSPSKGDVGQNAHPPRKGMSNKRTSPSKGDVTSPSKGDHVSVRKKEKKIREEGQEKDERRPTASRAAAQPCEESPAETNDHADQKIIPLADQKIIPPPLSERKHCFSEGQYITLNGNRKMILEVKDNLITIDGLDEYDPQTLIDLIKKES
jgi:hypothetical protein